MRVNTLNNCLNGKTGEGPPPPIDLARAALLLDVDGTLIDIAPTPDAVVVPGNLRDVLSHLRECVDGALALISGRSLDGLDALFSPLSFSGVGSHGAELRSTPKGKSEILAGEPLSKGTVKTLQTIAKAHCGVLMEDKHYALALHYRRVPEVEAALAAALAQHMPEFEKEGLELLRGKENFEIRRRGINKGAGLIALMKHAPFRGRQPVFIGDDTTDEDALQVLPEFGGTGMSVGRRLRGASHVFAGPSDVRAWLAMLAGKDGAV